MPVLLGNVLVYLAVCLAPPVLFWLCTKLPRLIDAFGDWRRSRGPEPPSGPPIERLAADLRRVHHSLESMPSHASAVRRRATNEAYDALLVQACRALDERQWLDTVPDGLEHEAERLRVEESLRRCGLVLP